MAPVACVLYPTLTMSFSELVAHPRPFNAVTDCADPTRLDLILNPNASPKYGGFKKATFGHTSRPVVGTSSRICLKQCWYQCKITGARITFDNPTQVVKLSSEINCLRWASALMDLVYKFMAAHLKSRNATPPFKIPKMRFIDTALAIAENSGHDTYMIEEIIDEAVDGEFIKYIGNSSAKPFQHFDSDVSHRANFLAFCQHVQYSKTKQLAFVGDFQGVCCNHFPSLHHIHTHVCRREKSAY